MQKSCALVLSLWLLAAAPAVAAPATGSLMIKDPYIAGMKAGELIFGAQRAREYLETMPDGTRWPLDRAEIHVRLSDQWTYATLGAWAITLAYAALVPDAGKDFWNNAASSPLRGFVGASGGLTFANWMFAQQFVVPFFKREAVRRNAETSQ